MQKHSPTLNIWKSHITKISSSKKFPWFIVWNDSVLSSFLRYIKVIYCIRDKLNAIELIPIRYWYSWWHRSNGLSRLRIHKRRLVVFWNSQKYISHLILYCLWWTYFILILLLKKLVFINILCQALVNSEGHLFKQLRKSRN